MLLETDFDDLGIPKRGKVRDVYDLGDKLLIVATDRVSAFDVVLPTGIPDKGKVLNQLSLFWFRRMEDLVENHVLESDVERFPDPLKKYADKLRGRSMVVKKARPFPVECVVRGYLAGSGWSEYRDKGSVCGIRLPAGIKESGRLDEPIFTPTTKAEEGHDIAISWEQVSDLVGAETASQLRRLAIDVYTRGRGSSRKAGASLWRIQNLNSAPSTARRLSSTRCSRRILHGSGLPRTTGQAGVRIASTSRSSEIISTPSIGTRPTRVHGCLRRSSRRPLNVTGESIGFLPESPSIDPPRPGCPLSNVANTSRYAKTGK